MKPNRHMSVDQVAAFFNDVMPVISDQHVIFSQIVDSVAYCTRSPGGRGFSDFQ